MKAGRLIGFVMLFLVFTVLLTCYQLIGSNILEAFSIKRPVVWLGIDQGGRDDSATSRGELGKLDISNRNQIKDTTTGYADFNVVAPSDADLLFTVNGLPISPVVRDTTPVHFEGVKLREGDNLVQASVRSKHLGQPETTTMEVEYRPVKPTYSYIVTKPYADPADGHVRLTVLTPPERDPQDLQSESSDCPLFAGFHFGGMSTYDFGPLENSPCYIALDSEHPDTRWRVWPLPVELAPKAGSGGASPSSMPVETVSTSPQKSMKVNVKDNLLTIEAHLPLPTGSALLDWVRHNEVSPREVADKVFAISLNPWYDRTPLDSRTYLQMQPYLLWDSTFMGEIPPSSSTTSPIESSVEVNDDDLVLRASMSLPPTGLAVQSSNKTLSYTITITASDHKSVELLSPAHWNGDVASVQVGSHYTSFYEPDSLFVLRRVASASTPAPALPVVDREGERGNGTVLGYLGNLQRMLPQFISTVFYALLGAVPFLWVLRITKNSGLPPRREREISAFCIVLLVLHFTIQSASILRLSLEQFRLGNLFHVPELNYRLTSLGSYYPFLAIGIVILLRPIFETYRRGPHRAVSPWRSLARGIMLVVSLAVVVGVTAYFTFGPIPHQQSNPEQVTPVMAAAGVGTAMLLFWIPLRFCLIFLLGVSVSMRAVFAANIAMLALPAVPSVMEFFSRSLIELYVKAFQVFPAFIPWQSSQTWWRWIVATLGALLLCQVAKLCLYMSYWKPGMYFTGRRFMRWLIIPFMIAAIPAWYAGGESNSNPRSPNVYDFSNFAFTFDALLPYVTVPIIIAIMRLLNPHDHYQQNTAINATVLSCGSLLFAYYLCGQAILLLFVPIPMLVGYFLFRRFLVLRSTAPRIGTALSVKDFLKKQTDGALAFQRKKSLDKKFGSGDMSYSVYRRSVAQLQRAFGLDDTFRTNEDTTSIFSTGAGGGPWRDAVIALKYGIPLSTPFQLMAVIRILRAPAGDFPVIYLFVQVMQTMVLWILIAFVFGYFYHAIRGRNGFQKALSFFLAFSFPTVLIQFAVETQTLNRGQLIELAQLGSFLLTLALLAFDVKVLSRDHCSWRDLPAAYGLTASTAYLGTLALSLVSTVAEPVVRDWLVKLLGH
jgi:hypothetical protein